MEREALDTPQHVFTDEDDTMGQAVGRLLARSGAGLFLDVGCGTLPCPGYMTTTGPAIAWIGVDPWLGQPVRSFPFAQAVGEYLPFLPEVFDGVLYASTIYHLIDPLCSLRRCRNILRPGGSLFVWFDRKPRDGKYLLWRASKCLGLARAYDQDFQEAFTLGSLKRVLRRAGFVLDRMVWLCERYCDEFATCEHRSEYLAIAC
jgi:SAM-dependent methyltransferase